MQRRLRTPHAILEDLAKRQGLVTPVPGHMALGPHFCETCLREGFADVLDRLKEIASARPQCAEAIGPLLDELSEAIADKRR